MRLRPTLLVMALLLVAACGGDATSTTQAATTTADAVTTTTTPDVTTTTTTKPEEDRVDGLGLAGGFEGGESPAEVPIEEPGVAYTGFQDITDDTGILTVSVPVEWDESHGGAWTENIFGVDNGPEGIGVALSSSSDLDGWTNTWTVPGVFFGASELLGGTIDSLLDVYGSAAESCTYDGRFPYDDGAYVGSYDWWSDCGGVGAVSIIIIARPAGEEFTAVVEITIVTEADLAAADEIVRSFYVTGISGEGGGGALDSSLEPNYGAGELLAGFEPDPQSLPVEAGGSIDVSAYLGGECAGFVTAAPDLEVTWSGSVGTLLRFYFVADTVGDDTVLVINDPAGDWWCSDDSYGGFNPTIDFAAGSDGVYDIWVGTYVSDALIPGTLSITELDANHP